MKALYRSLVVFALTSTVASTQAHEVLSDVKAGSVRKITVVSIKTRQAFARYAKNYLDNPTVRVGRLVAYQKSSDWQVAEGIGGTESNFSIFGEWLKTQNYFSRSSSCPEVQEALKLGNDIVLRFNDSHCRMTVELLGVRNPLRVMLGSVEVEIVAISIGDPGDRPELQDFVPVKFFASTSHDLSTRLATDLLRALLKTSGAIDASVVLRNDRLFMNQPQVPVVPWIRFLFDEKVSRSQYENRMECYCIKLRDWPVRCSEKP